ncbi:serine/threonine-protein kinase [Actinomadura hibisca]|uniref:serine/threonine-protein kinase n=1 Tax=Actinomadura hibisca TaxID=68565 RepID=UPI00082EB91C|nr:serine/threonine-protein kinase [Actinomadura hibisca]
MTEWRVPGYTELKVLGEGAQGRVVLARHDASGKNAAIKYLGARLARDADFRERFRGEAELLRRLRNPYVAGIFGLVETAGGAAIVMEAVDGASLKAVLAERGALAAEAALAVLKGSLLGLAAAHDLGIVHRDYKPANVIVRGDGLSKLIDFGIAVDAGAADRSGTPVYMAPEQWRAEPASPATDVYAATCVFFECVTGRRPYAADDRAALMHSHLAAPIPAEALPEPLRPLVEQGLAKNPWDRPPGAAAFVSELEAVATAAYGRDWEAAGVRALAGAAAALAMAFPLTALGMGGAGASAGGAGAAAGTSGTAVAASGKGVLGVLGTKGAVAVAGGAVAVTAAGGAAVYVAADDGPSRPRRPAPLSFALAGVNETSGTPALTVNGQVATVKGGDPALARRINAALRSPVDDRAQAYRKALVDFNAEASSSSVRPTVLLRTSRYLSVQYDIRLNSRTVSHSSWSRVRTVTVDLTTGQPLKAAQLFTPAGLSGKGLDALAAQIRELASPTRSCLTQRPIRPKAAQIQGKEGYLDVALTPRNLVALVDTPGFGFEMACGQTRIEIPYSALPGLVAPELVKAAGSTPSPTRS